MLPKRKMEKRDGRTRLAVDAKDVGLDPLLHEPRVTHFHHGPRLHRPVIRHARLSVLPGLGDVCRSCCPSPPRHVEVFTLRESARHACLDSSDQ